MCLMGLSLLDYLAKCLSKTGLKDLPAVAETFFGSYQCFSYIRKVPTAEIFQLSTFEQIPNPPLADSTREHTLEGAPDKAAWLPRLQETL